LLVMIVFTADVAVVASSDCQRWSDTVSVEYPRLRLGSWSHRRLLDGDRRVAPAARRLRRRGAGGDVR